MEYCHGVKSWWEDTGRKPAQEAQRVHVDGEGFVGVGAFEGDAHQAVALRLDALLPDRRTKHVTKKRLASDVVEGASARCGVQCEAVHRGGAATAVLSRTDVEPEPIEDEAEGVPVCRLMPPLFGDFLQGHAATRFAGSCRHQREGRDESFEIFAGSCRRRRTSFCREMPPGGLGDR